MIICILTLGTIVALIYSISSPAKTNHINVRYTLNSNKSEIGFFINREKVQEEIFNSGIEGLNNNKPDLLIVLGDRLQTLGCAMSANLFTIKIKPSFKRSFCK